MRSGVIMINRVLGGLFLATTPFAALAQWHPLPVCAAHYIQDQPAMVSDGNGGVVIAWQDRRGHTSPNCGWDLYCPPDIYIQRLSVDGSAMWDSNGVRVNGTQYKSFFPYLFYHQQIGTIVSWIETDDVGNNWEGLILQRISEEGQMLWGDYGIRLPATPAWYYPAVVSDGSGGIIVVWSGDMGLSTDADILAQRIDSSGTVLWGDSGIVVSRKTSREQSPVAATDGSGGVIIAWHDEGDIYAQRVDGDGTLLWTASGKNVISAPQAQVYPKIVSDGNGGAIIAWDDQRLSPSPALYSPHYIGAQHLDQNGAKLWFNQGLTVTGTIPAGNYTFTSGSLIPDGDRGAIIAWSDSGIWMTRIAGDGVRLWGPEGIRVSFPGSGFYDPMLASDGSGGVFAVWSHRPSGDLEEVRAQRISDTGISLWDSGGVVVAVDRVHEYSETPLIAANPGGDPFIAWVDALPEESGDWFDIAARKISRHGSFFEPDLASLSVKKGWNLVSLPLAPLRSDVRKLFPAAINGPYEFRSSYELIDSMTSSVGYWMKFADHMEVIVAGNMVEADTIEVSEGWNLLGTISIEVASSAVSTEPSSVTLSGFFEYGGNYNQVDSLKPGLGYWVKASRAGRIILPGSRR